MFEKLSNILKKTTDKIANAIFLDKNLVEGQKVVEFFDPRLEVRAKFFCLVRELRRNVV